MGIIKSRKLVWRIQCVKKAWSERGTQRKGFVVSALAVICCLMNEARDCVILIPVSPGPQTKPGVEWSPVTFDE